jgi:hypothetical protein
VSAIADIYAALAAKSVTAASKTPTVYSLSTLKKSAETADLPMRLLLPFNGRGPARDGQFISLGTLVGVTWRITDLCLWEPEAQTLGIAEVSPELIAYCGAYVDMLRTFRAPTAQSHLAGFTLAPDLYEWPKGSGRWYYGVECVLEIEEVLSA